MAESELFTKGLETRRQVLGAKYWTRTLRVLMTS